MTTEIKICGVRDPDIAQKAVELGAQYIGILCYSGSKRYVNIALGKQIAAMTCLAGGTPVAVCVDADAEMMLTICDEMKLDVVQLAGEISRQSHHQLPEHIQRIYVLHVDEAGVIQTDVTEGFNQLDFSRDHILFDGIESGSGKTFSLKQFSNPYPCSFFLAGGLNAENVTDRIQNIHPNAVDVSSGVESTPGVKDIDKIKAFIEAVREAAA